MELYVNELFSGNANKEQIQKIHQALDSFSRQKGAWKDALYFLSQTTNPQTAMYALTVLEVISVIIPLLYTFPFVSIQLSFNIPVKGFITRGWSGLLSEEQIELRTTLCHWLLEKHQFSPYFIRNKVCSKKANNVDAIFPWPAAHFIAGCTISCPYCKI